jgi:DNA processing protein
MLRIVYFVHIRFFLHPLINMLPELAYLHSLRRLPGVGSKTLERLVGNFGSAEAAWNAPVSAYADIDRIGSAKQDAMTHAKRSIDPEREWYALDGSDIRVMQKSDQDYPSLLREIPDAPYLLYSRGTFSAWNTRSCVAIVGSRKYTQYGRQAATQLSSDLTRAGIVVVSGLAFGVDSFAHEGALAAHGDTIAILGSGIDDAHITPQTHVPLAKRIIHSGAIMSEYPPGTDATPGSFPQRNRIMVGMSLGTVVIEAAARSGSLISAQLALDYDRDVFAVPGSIFSPVSAGTNQLIRSGAKIVTSVTDILEEFPVLPTSDARSDASHPTLTPDEEKIFSSLSHEPVAVDEIIKSSHCGASAVSTALTMLEIKGLTKDIGGQHYIRM